jgi:membrane associated rhomboid family serine protease
MTKTARLPLWVTALIVICIAIEAALTTADLLGYASARHLMVMLGAFWSQIMFHGTGLYTGQPILMFVTYGLLHGGVLHVAMNMVSLAAVGRELARMIGSRAMAVTYIICQISAAALYAMMEPQVGPMVGASGAIFGLAGALIGYATVNLRRRHKDMTPLVRSVVMILVLNVALTVMMPNIAWQAHLGGAAAGLVIGLFLGSRKS